MNYRKEKFINLSDKTIVVTGANGQIGLSLVKKLAQYNAKIVAVDLKVNNIDKMKQDNKIIDSNILILKSDINKLKEVKKIFINAKKKFNYINSLVCNAGVAVFENYMLRTEKSLDKVINVNIKGTFYCIREFINNYENKNGEGTIVNVASHYGLISPDPRIYVDTNRASSEIYGASKAAIIQMTKYFAVHALGKKALQKIKQGSGFRREYSKRCPMNRLAKINEVVDPILFLLSSSSSYINGHNLVIDGGYSIW